MQWSYDTNLCILVRCPHGDPANPYDSTASYDLRSLYDFVIVYNFTFFFLNRKTVTSRHVVIGSIIRSQTILNVILLEVLYVHGAEVFAKTT